MLIVGGGFGAVEALLALRALAPERVRVTLISASPVLAYKPAATTESFEQTPPRTYDLQAIAADVGSSFRVYELALLTATHLEERGAAGEVVLVSPESLTSPGKVFGRYLTPYLHTREPVLSQRLTDG